MEQLLKQRIQEDMKSSLRRKDKERLGIIRMIMAAIKQREVDERISLDDAQVIAVLGKMLKQRRDALNQFQEAGRQDLADKEAYEIGVIEEYLPPPLTEFEIDEMIGEAITSTGATTPRDIGKVMGALKARIQGRADLGLVSGKIKTRLAPQ